MKRAIINGKIVDSGRLLEGYYLLFDKEIISISKGEVPQDCQLIDANGSYVSAGFIDMHIHGCGGADVMDSTLEALETISDTLLMTGTTTLIATTMTMSQDSIINACKNIIKNQDRVSGAKIAGIHLEGPFINPLKSGAQDSRHIQKPNIEWIEPYLPYIKIITIAPEIEGTEEFIRYIKSRYPHIVLSIGHSEATYSETLDSINWGISHATHLFNAMPPLHHREPNIIGALFDSDTTVDIIADLIHLHPSTLRLVQRTKRDRVVLVTDAMRAGCMSSGIYDLGGQSVKVEDSRATLDSGVLAGSILRLNGAIYNYYTHTEATIAESIYAVTTLPSRLLGLSSGELKRGYSADIVIFDEEINISKVYVDGTLKISN